MKKITKDLENRIVVLLQKKESTRKIAEKTGVGKSTVIAVRKRNNLESPGDFGGRPRMLTDSDARQMERLLRKSSKLTPQEATLAINKPTSEWTARRALKRIGLIASVKQKKPALSKKNITARLQFCKEHKNWSVEDWKRIIWSDETKINRILSDGKSYYWHRPGEQLQQHQVKQTMKHGGGSIMAWACFTWWHVGPIHKIEGIMKKEDYLHILQTYLPEFVDQCAYPIEEIVFQHDGDPKHTSKIVKEWLEN